MRPTLAITSDGVDVAEQQEEDRGVDRGVDQPDHRKRHRLERHGALAPCGEEARAQVFERSGQAHAARLARRKRTRARPIQFGCPMGYKRRMKAGLSIVVPLYNEANGLARLHAQLAEVARKLAEKRDLSVEVVYVDDGSRDDTLKIARGLPASRARRAGAGAVAQFRQGGGARRRPRSCARAARCCSWTATGSIRRR